MRTNEVKRRPVRVADRKESNWRDLGRSERLALLLITVFHSFAAVGQNINRQQVNTLLIALKNSRSDEKGIGILLDLGRFHLYKPGETKADLDSSQTYLRQAKQLSDSLRLVTRQHEAESLLIMNRLEGGQTTAGRLQFSRLIADCQRIGDPEGEAIARYQFGVWLRNFAPDSIQVTAQFRRAAALYRAIHQPQHEIQALQEIAVKHLYEGKILLAESELRTVLERYQTIGYPKLHYTYNLLAEISRIKGNLDQGLKYALLCIDSMHKTADTASAAAFFGDLAQLYEVAGNHSKSMEWHRKSLAAWRQERLPNFALFNTAGVIAKDLIAQHKPIQALAFYTNLVHEIPTNTLIQKACVAQNLAYCYDALKNYRLAEKYYREALQRYEKNNLDFEESLRIRNEMGAFYFEQKRYNEARYYLTKALTVLPQKEALSTLKDIQYLLFKVDSAQGNYLLAINHFNAFKMLNDSLFNEAKSRQINQLQIQYDTRAKEQNIALLTKQSELQQSALKRAETTRKAIISGAVLLAGLLGVSYNRYRLKQRSNRLLEAKQREIDQKNQSLEQIVIEKEGLLDEKEWMLKEIHHRVKNNLQIITSMLNAQSDFLDDPMALAAIRDSQNRVHAMSLIHQKLYQSEQLAQVNMAEYVDEILDYLLESFSRSESVQTRLTVASIALHANVATPIGLIINESVTNSLKYAFPDAAISPRRAGLIQISLQPLNEQTYRLLIGDNGVGLPADFSLAQSHTLGLPMIQGLSRQIGGQLTINQDGGVQIQVDFNPVKKADRTPVEAD